MNRSRVCGGDAFTIEGRRAGVLQVAAGDLQVVEQQSAGAEVDLAGGDDVEHGGEPGLDGVGIVKELGLEVMEEAGGVVVKGGLVWHLGVEFMEASAGDAAAAVLKVLAETHAAVMIALMVVAEALSVERGGFAEASVSAVGGTEFEFLGDDGGFGGVGHLGGSFRVGFLFLVSRFWLRASAKAKATAYRRKAERADKGG